MSAKGIPASVRTTVAQRSGGFCEGCGIAGPLELHHRKFRSRSGQDTAGNLIALCGWGNHTGCHGTAHSGYLGESLGWAVRSGHDPLLVPAFRRADRTWWRFNDEGGSELVPVADAIEYMRLINAIREGVVAE